MVVNNTVYHLLVLAWKLRYFFKRGSITKRVCWNRGLMYLCRFCIGVSFDFLINFLRWALFSYNYVLATLLQNNAKFIQKLNPGFKNHMSNLDNFRQAVESPKSWKFYGLIFSKMYITSAKILYEEDISNV